MIDIYELRLALRIDDELGIEDGLLQAYLAAAIEYVQNDTGRYFGPQDAGFEDVQIGTGTRDLWLSDEPQSAVTVIEATSAGDAGTAVTDFAVRGRRLVRHRGVWARDNEYRATYTRGYSPADVPPAIRHAVLMLVTHWYELRMPVAVGNIVTAIPFGVNELLAPHRNIGIA